MALIVASAYLIFIWISLSNQSIYIENNNRQLVSSQQNTNISDTEEKIRFIDSRSMNIFNHHFPPFLISYPCSGNTFIRLLLEYTTLIWTGSIYGSQLRQIGFKGEIKTDESVIIIKIHPMDTISTNRDNIIDMQFDNISLSNIAYKKRWRRIQKSINKYRTLYNEQISAIFLIRNVFKTCWSYFQFKNARDIDPEIAITYDLEVVKRHLSSFIMTRDKFNTQILPQWRKYSIKCSKTWLHTFKWIERFKYKNRSFVIIEFEKLMDIKYRESEMKKLLRFIFNENYLNTNEHDMMLKMKQTMENIGNVKRAKLIHRPKNRENRIDEKYAYSVLSDDDICKMMQNAKYQSVLSDIHPPRNVSC